MNNSEKYKRTFSAIHPSADYMEAIVKTEGKKMESKKRYSMPKILAACLAAVLLLAGVTAGAYAADVGGIQRKVQIWTQGELTDAVFTVTTDGKYSEYTATYTDADGKEHTISGGGVAYDFFGRERALTEEELLEEINSPQIDITEDGRFFVYCRDQKIEITDKFEDGICHVKLTIDGKPLYMTVSEEGGFSTSPRRFPKI